MFKVMISLHMNNKCRKFINTFKTMAEANRGIHDLFVDDAVRAIFKDNTGKPYDIKFIYIDKYYIDIVRYDTNEILGNINIIKVTENEIENSNEAYPEEPSEAVMNLIPTNECLSDVVNHAYNLIESPKKKNLKPIIYRVANRGYVHGYAHGFDDGFHAGINHESRSRKAIDIDYM